MSDAVTAPDSDSEPPRKFGVWTGLWVVVSCMVGSGILTTSGYTIRDTESHLALLALWSIGGVLALCAAACVTEMAVSLPHVGGDYVFVREGYGPGAAFVYGWGTAVFGFAGPIAVVAHAAGEYLCRPFRQAASDFFLLHHPEYVGGTFVVALTIIHCLGHEQSSWTQGVTTLGKLLVLGGFVVAGLVFGSGDWSHLTMGKPLAEQQPTVLATNLFWVMYGYTGWNAAAYLAGETKDAARTLPRCLIGGTLAVTVLYLLMNLTYAYALSPTELRNAPDEDVTAVAEFAARRMFGPAVSAPLSVLIGVGMISSLSSFILTGPRVMFAMARDGLFPSAAGRLHTKWKTPVAALIAQATLVLLFLQVGTFRDLLDYTSVGLSILAALMVSAIFRLRRLDGLEQPYRVPLYPLPPLLFLLASAWMVAYGVWRNLPAALGCVVSLAAGILVYSALDRRRAKRDRDSR